MATDATGTPTSPDSIPKYNTAVDAPSGKGFNAAMDQLQVALSARVSKPSGIATGEVPVWNGSAFVRSSVTNIGPSSLGTGSPSSSTFLRGDGTWASAGQKTTVSLLSAGPPGSPADGDIWIARAVDTGVLSTTNGTTWTFVYNNSSASANKWETLGASDLALFGLSGGSGAISVAPGTLIAASALTVPRTGDYRITFGGLLDDNNNWQNVGLWLWDTTASAAVSTVVMGEYASGNTGNMSLMTKVTASLVSGHILKLGVADSNSSTNVSVSGAHLALRPLRIQ